MSNNTEKWEEALAESVKKHEFAFDPAAWAELDQLMNQARVATQGIENVDRASRAPSDSVPVTGSGVTTLLTTKVFLGLLAVLITTILLAVWRSPSKEANGLGTEMIQAPEKVLEQTAGTQTEDRESTAPEKTVTSANRIETATKTKTKSSAGVGASPSVFGQPVDNDFVSDYGDDDSTDTLVQVTPPQPGEVTVIQALPRGLPPLLKYSDLATSLANKKFTINPPIQLQRPTLFPEVKDKY